MESRSRMVSRMCIGSFLDWIWLDTLEACRTPLFILVNRIFTRDLQIFISLFSRSVLDTDLQLCGLHSHFCTCRIQKIFPGGSKSSRNQIWIFSEDLFPSILDGAYLFQISKYCFLSPQVIYYLGMKSEDLFHIGNACRVSNIFCTCTRSP